jgi:hypothetical protein
VIVGDDARLVLAVSSVAVEGRMLDLLALSGTFIHAFFEYLLLSLGIVVAEASVLRSIGSNESMVVRDVSSTTSDGAAMHMGAVSGAEKREGKKNIYALRPLLLVGLILWSNLCKTLTLLNEYIVSYDRVNVTQIPRDGVWCKSLGTG